MIDKRLLKDFISVSLAGAKDDWGKVTYHHPFKVNNVRFDRSSIGKFINNQKLINVILNKTGTIFIYPKYSKVEVDDSWLQAKISDYHGEYKVIGIETNYFRNKVFSYELTVI